MRKLFSIFAAMLVVLAVNAATTEVSPGKNALKTAVAAAAAGDVLVLGDGIFYEEGNFDMKINLTIKAADGAKPVIANRYYFRVEGGADVTFQGIKFDGAGWRDGDAAPLGASDYLIRSYNASTGEEDITFEDCEITGYPSYVMYTQRANRKWNSITINGCYFYSNVRSAVYIGNESGTEQSCNALTIKNSTFANVTDSYDVIYYAAPAENHTTPLSVDHCTFYGHPKRAIYWQVSENLTVTNCIFAQPASVSYKSVECVAGSISNCLSYNSAGYSSAATSTNNIVEDPLFKDAANNDFTLGAGSPALTAGSDGKPIGDPRWVPSVEPVEPLMKTIYCKMDKAWWTADNAAVGIYAWGDNSAQLAAWPGVRMTPVEGATGVWSIELDINTYKNCIFTRVNGSGDIADWGAKTANQTIPTDDNDMFTITNDAAVWGDPGCTGAWSKYEPAAPAVDEWAEIKFAAAAAADEIPEEASYTVPGTEFALTLHDAGNKMVIDGNDCRFGTAEAYTMYNFRLKSGGASGSDKNYFTLNIPEAGTLRIAPRTGSNSATDRALIVIQGGDTLYNQIVQESQAIEVQEGENTIKVYPYVDVTVAAGEVVVRYTAGMNFYAFAFKAGGAPEPAHTYTVAGSSAIAFGTAWTPANTDNDMVKQEDGTYKWEKSNLELPAGTIEFKVCQDHAWATCWPAENYQLAIAESGVYTLTITFEPANDNKVNAVATKTGEAVVIPTIAMHGNFLGSWADTENFVIAEGDETASLKLTLVAGNYEFGMRIGGSGNWTANGVSFTRENASAEVVAGSGNLKLEADKDGDYVFTWTYATNTLSISFPVASGIDNTNVAVKAQKVIINGQLFIIRDGQMFNAQGQLQ